MKEGEAFLVERQRGDGREAIEQLGNFDEVAEAALGGGVLGVLARFDRQSWREERRGVAGVVPEIEFVKIPAGRHALALAWISGIRQDHLCGALRNHDGWRLQIA